MSIAEKLANLRDERLARKHTCLQARDWIDGAMYDEAQGVTMDAWALMVANEDEARARYEELCSIEEPTEEELLEAIALYERLYPDVDHSY